MSRRKPTRPFRHLVLWPLAALVFAAVAIAISTHVAVGAASDRVYADITKMPAHTVVIVPGAGLTPSGTPHGFLTQRLICAQALFDAGRARHILVSGDGGSRSHDEANAMRRWLEQRGVPKDKIQMDYAGFRTRDTMQRAARVFEVRDAAICTQGLHANRTAFLALDAGLDADVLIAGGDEWFTLTHQLRERAATIVAAIDAIVGTPPRFLGPRIPITAARTP